MKKYLVGGALVGAMAMLVLSGCVIREAYGPRPAAAPQVRSEAPVVETRQVGERRVEFHSRAVPPASGGHEIKLGARPVNPQSVADWDRRLAGQTDLRVWHSPRRLYCKVQQAGGKWVTGWLPAGTQLLTRREGERDGIVLWRVIEVARCGNPVEDVFIREINPRTETTIREREVVEYEQPAPAPVYTAPAYGGAYWGCGWGPRQRSTYRSNITINRSVNINRTVAPPPPRYQPQPRPRPQPRPAPRYCPPGMPARR